MIMEGVAVVVGVVKEESKGGVRSLLLRVGEQRGGGMIGIGDDYEIMRL